MPLGIIVNACAIIIGGFIGSVFSKFVPQRVSKNLVLIFGLSSMVIGISLINKMHSLPGVVLSLILGTIIGELIDFEKKIERFSVWLEEKIIKITKNNKSEDKTRIEKIVSLLILFCTGSTGLLGSMTEALSGEHTVLFAKSILDFFTSAIFAISLGYIVISLCIPQFIVLMTIFLFTKFVAPDIDPNILGDFMACGGAIAIAIGFRLCEIKQIRVTNMIPSLILVFLVSWIWNMIF